MTLLDDRPARADDRTGGGRTPPRSACADVTDATPAAAPAPAPPAAAARRPLPSSSCSSSWRPGCVSLNLVHAQTLDAYEAGDKPRTLTWGERQGWVNVVEPFRSPFAIGDAHVLSGHFELARPWFEQAFEQVPKGGIDDCKVRVNLGLTYEALGDAAKARERTDEWKQYYDKGITITKERPPLCEAPEGGQTGEQLQQAQQRMEQKNSDAPPQDQQPPDEPQQQPGPSQPAAPDAGPGQDPEPGGAGLPPGAAATEHHRAQPATAAGQRRHRRPATARRPSPSPGERPVAGSRAQNQASRIVARCSSTSIAFLPHDSGRVRPAGSRVTRTRQRRPSAWVTMTSQPPSISSGSVGPEAPRAGSRPSRRARATRRTATGPGTPDRPRSWSGPSSSAGRCPVSLAASSHSDARSSRRAKVWPQGRSTAVGREPVAAGVGHLPRAAGRDPRGMRGERASAHGAAHVAATVGAHEQGRLTGSRPEERGLHEGAAAARERAPVESEQVADVGRPRPSSSHASSGLAPAWATSTVPRAVVRRVPTGTPDEHEASARPAGAGVQLGPELAVEVRLAGRVAPPRSGLFDDDEEARASRPCRRRSCRRGPTGPSTRRSAGVP